MAATAEDIYIEQGATFRKTITVTSGVTPVDVSTWTGRGVIKAAATDTAVIAEFTLDFTDGATGLVHFGLTDTETDAIVTTGAKYSNLTKLVYDVELDDGTTVYRAANGVASVSPSVTRPNP